MQNNLGGWQMRRESVSGPLGWDSWPLQHRRSDRSSLLIR